MNRTGGVIGTCAAVIVLVLISDANGWFAGLNPLTVIPDPLIGAAVRCVAPEFLPFRPLTSVSIACC